MNKYIKKNKHFRFLYNKAEHKYIYTKYYKYMLDNNNNFLYSNFDILKRNLILKRIGNYRSKIFNCCILTGRSNSIHRKFLINRSQLRSFISKGILPGVRKASW